MKKIILLESQFNYILNNTLKEGLHKTASTRTFGGKIRSYVLPAEKKLQLHGESLFKDNEVVDELNEIADAVDNKEISINDFLDEDNFKDNDAYQLVLQWIKGIRYRGDNKYANILSSDAKKELDNSKEARESNKLNNMSNKERAINRNITAKENKYSDLFNSEKFTLDALNYYNTWKGGDFPVNVNLAHNKKELNDLLLPYFKNEDDYSLYMNIKQKCNELGQYAFDGDAVYTPIVGKPIVKQNGISFSEKNGKKQIPKNWAEMYKFLRSKFQVSPLQITNEKPQCFFVKLSY